MLAVLSQIGLHFRHNSHILWFWDLYSRITVYGWVVITHVDFEATDGDLAHSHPPATLPSEGSCRSCYIHRKIGSKSHSIKSWTPVFRIRSGLGQICWAENSQNDFFKKKKKGSATRESRSKRVRRRLGGWIDFLIALDLKADTKQWLSLFLSLKSGA